MYYYITFLIKSEDGLIMVNFANQAAALAQFYYEKSSFQKLKPEMSKANNFLIIHSTWLILVQVCQRNFNSL